MRKKHFFFLAFFFILTFFSFSKEKLSEKSDTLAYKYSDWKEFYSDLIEASQKETYKYAFLRNLITDDEEEITNGLKDNSWKLVSYKFLQERDMIYSFFVVSPNNHSTVLILSNNQVVSNHYKIADKYSNASFRRNDYTSSASSEAVSSASKAKKSPKKTVSEIDQNDEKEKIFLERIIFAFDEQLCFFDEDVPLKLQDFDKIKTSQNK